jgi:hypothetical protein
MGKRIDELQLNDHPIEHQVESLEARESLFENPAEDVRDTEWYQFAARLDDLIESAEFTWAFDTLSGIRETVEHTRRVSDGQRRAVANIEARGETQRGGTRRYDGFYGRPR